jgi:molybdopterin converting factor small subunit
VLGIAIGVPLLAIVVFIGLVASGVVQDRSKREYCRSWNQLASALGEEQAGLAAAVADGDRVALERITDQLIEDLEALSAPARATGLDAPVEAMLDHLRSQREALAESDEARLSELVNQVDQFVSQSQELLAASVRACG